jgi:hypothetical protein
MICRTFEKDDGTVQVILEERHGRLVSFSGGAIAESLDAVPDALHLLMEERNKGEVTAFLGKVEAGIGRVAQ